MNCKKIKELIDRGQNNDNPAVKNHSAQCDKCRKHLEASINIKALFEKYDPVMDDPDPEKFNSILFEKLENIPDVEFKLKRRWFFRPAFSFSFVALAVFFIAAFFFFPAEHHEKTEAELESVYTTQKDEPVGIVIEYESNENVEEVTVSFALDRGVRFHSENDSVKELDSFVWKGSFSKGKNEIPFVVDIVETGKWEIVTVAEFEGYRHRHKITLDASSEVAVVKIFRYEPEKIRQKV